MVTVIKSSDFFIYNTSSKNKNLEHIKTRMSIFGDELVILQIFINIIYSKFR